METKEQAYEYLDSLIHGFESISRENDNYEEKVLFWEVMSGLKEL